MDTYHTELSYEPSQVIDDFYDWPLAEDPDIAGVQERLANLLQSPKPGRAPYKLFRPNRYTEVGIVLVGDTDSGYPAKRRNLLLAQLTRRFVAYEHHPVTNAYITHVIPIGMEGGTIKRLRLDHAPHGDTVVADARINAAYADMYSRIRQLIEEGRYVPHLAPKPYGMAEAHRRSLVLEIGRMLGRCAVDQELTQRFTSPEALAARQMRFTVVE